MGSNLLDQIPIWQERLSNGQCLSREEFAALRSVLTEAALALQENSDLVGYLDELEARLLGIENSRFMSLLRWPGRLAHDWRGHLGQLLLHSRLHPAYLKIVRSGETGRAYRAWIEQEQKATPSAEWFQEHAARFERQPLCSVVMPVHNPRREWLQAAIDSVRRQFYSHWELCICDDASAAPWVSDLLDKAAAADSRIRSVHTDACVGISGALNRAAQLAAGDYIGFLDHDDVLPPYALHYVVAALQRTDADLIYSDEDRLDGANCRIEPIFKPAWSPDLLLSCMYLGHFLVVKRSRFKEAGGFRPEVDGSQDHDLALRLSDHPLTVRHIPRILYHWRKHAASTAASSSAKPYAQTAGRRALEDCARRRGIEAVIEHGVRPNTYRIRRSVVSAGKATLVICSRREDLAVRCVRAIREITDYADYEIVLVQHGVKMQLQDLPCKPLYYEGEFNFAHMNNLGAAAASGTWLVFINDDVIPLHSEWLTELARQAARPEVGVVGATLLYPSGAIQHAGIVIGMMDAVGHLHRDTFGSPFWSWSDLTRNVSAVTGACMGLRKQVFDELGGFDEGFPVNFNDVDLCLRARARGYEVIYEASAVLRHWEGQTRHRGVGWRELRRWRTKWPDVRTGQDPFSSPHLNVERENASLRLDEVWSPEDNSR